MSIRIVLILVFTMIAGCSSETDQTAQENSSKDHAWKSQTQVMDKAKDVENMVRDLAKERQEKMEKRSDY